jgi:ribosomal protein S18 acetylase RimI-like enzyme
MMKVLGVQDRFMTREDLDAVMAIEASLALHEWTRDEFQSALRMRYVNCRVVTVGGVVIGYMVYLLAPAKLEILRLVVGERWRRRRVASHLFYEVVTRCSKAAKLPAVRACVPERCVDAQVFLRWHGMRFVKFARGAYAGEDGYVLEFVDRPAASP